MALKPTFYSTLAPLTRRGPGEPESSPDQTAVCPEHTPMDCTFSFTVFIILTTDK